MFALFFLLGGASVARAQSSQFGGRVTDTSGAVIPGVTVTAISVATGLQVPVVTNAEGYYTIPGLEPGRYTLKLELEGFSTFQRTDLVLEIGQAARIDVTMQVGQLADVVTVVAAIPIIQRDTTSVGTLVDNLTITTLPLNGRDYTQLLELVPGTTRNTDARAADGISMNGARTLQTNYRVDGIDNNNYIVGLDTGSTQALRPSVDSIQEFKVESANFSAQFGNAAGGVVQIGIKSGTNQFKGSAFEFYRNDALDSNDYFAKRAGLDKAPLDYHQFGGTLGGPIAKDRTFFFASYQGTRSTSSLTTITTLPTADMRNGNFGSIAIYDPRAVAGGVRQPFPNNTIPQNRMDPVALKILADVPLPNQPGTRLNYAASVPTTDNADQVDGRLDQTFGKSNRGFLRFSWQDRTVRRSGIFEGPAFGANAFNREALLVTPAAFAAAGGFTQVIGGNTLNEIRVGYTQNSSAQETLVDESLFAEYGITGVPDASRMNGYSSITINNYTRFGSRTGTPNDKRASVFQINDTLTWSLGVHTLKTGAEVRFKSNLADSSSTARGTFTFNGQYTSQRPGTGIGDPFADFLLGQASRAAISQFQYATLLDQYFGVFVEDVWRLTPSLTVNAGVRYELQTPPVEKDNRFGNFDYEPGSPTYGTMIVAKDGSYQSRSFIKLDTNNVSPRVGAAYSITPQMVLRGSYGHFYSGLGYLGNNQMGAANPPYYYSSARASGSSSAASLTPLSGGFPADMLDPATISNPAVNSQWADSPISQTRQWNITLERQLPWQLTAGVAYVGSRTKNLRGEVDINQPLPGPGGQNPRRPFPTYGSISQFSAWGRGQYDAFQAKVERRYAKGLSLMANYTFGQAMSDSADGEEQNIVGIQDPNNLAAEWARSRSDVRHRFVFNLIYDLPFGKGQDGAWAVIIRNWQVGAIVNAQSGSPLTVTISPNPANTGGTGRPDQLRDGNLPSDQRSISNWYDVTAFAPAAQYTFGNAPRSSIIGPGVSNTDLLISRRFALGSRYRLDLRAEIFNVFNITHYGNPEMNINSPDAGVISSVRRPPRQVQLGARLVF